MTGFTMEYTTKRNELVVIEGAVVKYWAAEGLPTFEGDLEGLEKFAPSVIAEMLKRGIISSV